MAKKKNNKLAAANNRTDAKSSREKNVSFRRNEEDDMAYEAANMIGISMSFAASEAYKLLRTNIMFSFSGDERCRVVGLTSSFRGEGKSLTSLNLAYTLAEAKHKVLLIEGDMRLPTLSKRLRFNPTPGLSNLLVGLNTVSDAIQQYIVPIEDADAITLDVIVSGNVPPNPSELLGSQRMQSLIRTLRDRYDYIVLDLPPVTAVTDALVASRLADGMVVVVRNNVAVRDALAETLRQLQQVGTRILGFVFNGAGEGGPGYYYSGRYYSRSKYYRGYGRNYYRSGYYSQGYDRISQKK